jgi:hypothetical protein
VERLLIAIVVILVFVIAVALLPKKSSLTELDVMTSPSEKRGMGVQGTK